MAAETRPPGSAPTGPWLSAQLRSSTSGLASAVPTGAVFSLCTTAKSLLTRRTKCTPARRPPAANVAIALAWSSTVTG
jgi:hypothetical protein